MTSSFHCGPLPFITISDSGECRVDEHAAKLLSQIKGKVAVISVAGWARTGKSFLLNRLMGTQEGFEVGTRTRGIWIWGQPVELGEDYFAILMDTEGLNGGRNDAKIFSLTMLLSSYLVLNSSSDDQWPELRLLNEIARSSTSAGCSLLWVLRDFAQQVSPNEYIERVLRDRNAESIKNLFPDRDCLALVRPAENGVDLHQINKVPFDALRGLFQSQVEKFVEKVYTSVQPKTVADVLVSGPLLVQLATQYCSAVSDHVPLSEIMAMAWSNVIQLQLKSSLRECVSIYRSVLNNEGMNKLPLSDSQINDVHLKAKALAKASFPTSLLKSSSLSHQEADSRKAVDLNQSISIADVGSPELFLREFKLRREQLLDHLKVENKKISINEMQKLYSQMRQSLSGAELMNTFAAQCTKFPMDAYAEFLASNYMNKNSQFSVDQRVNDNSIRVNLSSKVLNNDGWNSQKAGNTNINPSMDAGKTKDENIFTSKRIIEQFKTGNEVLPSRGNLDGKVMTTLNSVKELLISGLSEMKSAELDVRSAQVRTENDQKLMELERKFNKQLGEARRKNEMLISDLKLNYENEVSELKAKKSQLEQSLLQATLELDTAKQALNEQALRTNFGNVINQQSELILQFLKSGSLDHAQVKGLESLNSQYRNITSSHGQ